MEFEAMTTVTLARLRYLMPGVTAEDYAAAVLDLNTSIGEDVLTKTDLPSGTAFRTRGAINDTPLAFAALASILTAGARTEEERENVVFLLAKAIDDALNLGAFYMAGRPKDDLPPPITAEQIAREMASRGGIASGKKRQAKLEEGWHSHAKSKALEIRSKFPSIAQRALAVEIGEWWKAEGFKPGFDALLKFVRTCEANGSIPRRTVY